MADERYLTTADLVRRLGVHERTVWRWIKSGELAASMLGRRAGYRIAATDFAAFMEGRKDLAVRTAASGPTHAEEGEPKR